MWSSRADVFVGGNVKKTRVLELSVLESGQEISPQIVSPEIVDETTKIRSNASRRNMLSSGPCYLCRLLSFRHFRPCPSITVNDTICQMCLDTFPQAGDLVDSFHLPMPVAAKRHGMSPYKFRSLYTKRGITKWPYRLLRPPVASGCARRWRSVWSLGTLNPDPGPACTRRALGSHLPEIARLFPA